MGDWQDFNTVVLVITLIALAWKGLDTYLNLKKQGKQAESEKALKETVMEMLKNDKLKTALTAHYIANSIPLFRTGADATRTALETILKLEEQISPGSTPLQEVAEAGLDLLRDVSGKGEPAPGGDTNPTTPSKSM